MIEIKAYTKVRAVKDGKIAVLVSQGYGAGWYSWNTDYPDCLFDPEIVILVYNEAISEDIEKAADKKWPGGSWMGAKGLYIEWLDEGSTFNIECYDGYERLEYADYCIQA